MKRMCFVVEESREVDVRNKSNLGTTERAAGLVWRYWGYKLQWAVTASAAWSSQASG